MFLFTSRRRTRNEFLIAKRAKTCQNCLKNMRCFPMKFKGTPAQICTVLAICFVGVVCWLAWYSGVQAIYPYWLQQNQSDDLWSLSRVNASSRCLVELMVTFGISGLNLSALTYIRLPNPVPISSACQSDLKHNTNLAAAKIPKLNISDPALQAQIHSIVHQLLQKFTQRNLEMFICGGTLLGSVRHFGIFPWDADVDLMIPTEQKPQARQLLRDLSASGEFRFVDTEQVNQHWHFFAFCPPQPEKPCKTLIDFFFGRVNKGKYTRLEYPFEFSVTDVYPLRLRPYGPYLVPAPRNAENFLYKVYGGDFKSNCRFKYYGGQVFRCESLRRICPIVKNLKFHYNGIRLRVDVLMDEYNMLALFVL